MPNQERKIIYVTHSKDFDFQGQLYLPLRESPLNDIFQLVLPHESSDQPFSSKEFMRTCYRILAEVSYPSTGQGIELGWADFCQVPIVCFHRQGFKPPGSLKALESRLVTFEYKDEAEMIERLTQELTKV